MSCRHEARASVYKHMRLMSSARRYGDNLRHCGNSLKHDKRRKRRKHYFIFWRDIGERNHPKQPWTHRIHIRPLYTFVDRWFNCSYWSEKKRKFMSATHAFYVLNRMLLTKHRWICTLIYFRTAWKLVFEWNVVRLLDAARARVFGGRPNDARC